MIVFWSILNLAIFGTSMYYVQWFLTNKKKMDYHKQEALLDVEAMNRAGEYLAEQIDKGEYQITDITTLLSDLDVLRIRFRNEDQKNPAEENRR